MSYPNLVSIFGTKYQVQVLEPNQNHPRPQVVIKEQTLLVITHQTALPQVHQKIISFLQNTARSYLVSRTHQLSQIMGIKFNRISLKTQKTRWGSCSSHGNLNFNYQLIHQPIPVIDYVIIHELAHRTHMNHSKAFWGLVAQFDHEYLKHRGYLKRVKMDLD